MPQTNRPSLAAAVLRWQRDSIRARGFVGSFRYLAEQFVECVKDSLPERRRSRFGDIDYDCDHAVDTTWARLRSPCACAKSSASASTSPRWKRSLPRSCSIWRPSIFETFTFIDLGSGKGRAFCWRPCILLRRSLASRYSRSWMLIARQNIERFRRVRPAVPLHRVALRRRPGV